MDESTITKLSKQIARKFPEMEGVIPSLKRKAGGNRETQFELTFKGNAELPGGKTMRRIVRVIADEKGRIIRMSTSK